MKNSENKKKVTVTVTYEGYIPNDMDVESLQNPLKENAKVYNRSISARSEGYHDIGEDFRIFELKNTDIKEVE